MPVTTSMRISCATGTMRFSDDGEPQGTAGMPVLDVLRKSGVTDVVTVATRYFGGILLGGGGLVRAYSHTASIALQAAQIITMRECLLLSLTCDYGRYGRVASLVPECGGVTDDTVFEEKVTVKFHLAPELLGAFRQKTCGCHKRAGRCDRRRKKIF